jgi:large subunit ribosomal protein L14e
MLEVGRVCYKLAGRDSNNVCAIVEVVDDKYVVVDGNVRRRKVNVAHIEPTAKTVEVGSGSTEDVTKALEGAGFTITKKGEARKAGDRPRKVRKSVTKAAEKKAPAKKADAKPAAKKKVAAKKEE